MLIHAMKNWPEVVTVDPWPFTLRMVVDIHNATPGPSGQSPEEILSKENQTKTGSLTFTPLDARYLFWSHHYNKNTKSLNGIYLGHSPQHAQTIPIVLNINTELCSSQYHVLFDDTFSTIKSRVTNIIP